MCGATLTPNLYSLHISYQTQYSILQIPSNEILLTKCKKQFIKELQFKIRKQNHLK